jgi:hypothetical protein
VVLVLQNLTAYGLFDITFWLNSLTQLSALLAEKHDKPVALPVVDLAMLSGSGLCGVDGRQINVLMKQRWNDNWQGKSKLQGGKRVPVQVEYPLSEIPKPENLQNPKLFARRHEHSAVQM